MGTPHHHEPRKSLHLAGMNRSTNSHLSNPELRVIKMRSMYNHSLFSIADMGPQFLKVDWGIP